MNLKEHKASLVVASLLSVFAVVLLYSATMTYGAGLQWDSVGYTVAARNFHLGDGFRLVYHVPMYPMLLATVALVTSSDPTAIAHLLNIALTTAMIFLAVGMLARAGVGFHALAIIALAGVFVIFQPLFFVSQYALSELTFATLSMVYLVLLVRVDEQPSTRRVVALAVIAAVLSLTRYVGIIFVPMGLIVLWEKRSALSRADLLRMLLIYAVIGTLPLLSWFLKNILLYETISGERSASQTGLLKNIKMTARAIGGWFYPRIWLKDVTWLAPVIGTVIPLAAIVVAFVLKRFWRTRLPYFLVLLFLLHTLAIILVSSFVLIDPIADRLLAPSAVPLGMLIAFDIALLYSTAERRRTRIGLTVVFTIFFVFWIGHSGVWVWGQVHRGMTRGVPGYQSLEWKDRPTLDYLVDQQQQLPRTVFTNEWPAVHLHTKMYAAWMPSFTDERIHHRLGNTPLTMVLFFNGDEWSDPNSQTFLDGYTILLERRFSDGRVLVVQRKKAMDHAAPEAR